MKNSLCIITLSLLVSFSSFAQLSKKQLKSVEELKELPLLVLLDGSEKFNQDFRTAVEYELDYFENYKFVTLEELDTLKKDKNNDEKFGVMQFHFVYHLSVATGNSISLSLLGEKSSIITSSLYTTEESISDGDLHFVLQRLEWDIQFANDRINMEKSAYKEKYKDAASWPNKLKTMTLLIDENSITDNAKENIAKIYPYTYKIVAKDVIDLAIINQEENTAYFRISAYRSAPTLHIDKNSGSTVVRSVTDYNLKMIFDAQEKNYLLSLRPAGLKLGDSEKSNQLSIKDLEDIVKMIN